MVEISATFKITRLPAITKLVMVLIGEPLSSELNGYLFSSSFCYESLWLFHSCCWFRSNQSSCPFRFRQRTLSSSCQGAKHKRLCWRVSSATQALPACDVKFSIIGGLAATSSISLSQIPATGNGVTTVSGLDD